MASETAIRSFFPVTVLFPDETSNPFHYEIAHHGRFYGKNTDLEIKDKEHGLTPLALAAMAGHADLVGKLIKRGANPLPLDAHEWTPLHYARVNRDKTVEVLIRMEVLRRNAANRSQKLELPELSEMDAISDPSIPERNVALIQTQTGFEVIDQVRFKQITGCLYRRDPYASQNDWYLYWKGSIAEQLRERLGVKRWLYDQLLASRKSLPPVAINPKHRELRVVATENISRFQVLGSLGLDINENNDEFTTINGSRATNPISLICDGLPNCAIMKFVWHGVPIKVCITLQPVQAGEELFFFFNYDSELKSRYRNYPLKDLNTDFGQIWNRYVLNNSKNINPDFNRQSFLEMEADRHLIFYLLNNPFLVFQLLLKRKISPEQVQEILETRNWKDLGFDEDLKEKYHMILTGWNCLEKQIESFATDTRSLILDQLELIIKKNTFDQIGVFFDHLISHLDSVIDFKSWQKAEEILSQDMQAFELICDWLKDEESDLVAEVAFGSIHARNRAQVLSGVYEVVEKKGPAKLSAYRKIRANLSIAKWIHYPSETNLAAIRYAFEQLDQISKQEVVEHQLLHLMSRHFPLIVHLEGILF